MAICRAFFYVLDGEPDSRWTCVICKSRSDVHTRRFLCFFFWVTHRAGKIFKCLSYPMFLLDMNDAFRNAQNCLYPHERLENVSVLITTSYCNSTDDSEIAHKPVSMSLLETMSRKI